MSVQTKKRPTKLKKKIFGYIRYDSLEMDTVSVVGLGYVGLPLALLAEKNRFNVLGFDIDKKKVEAVNSHSSPINDSVIAKELGKAKNISATTEFSKIKSSGTVVVCVPTPVKKNHMPDLKHLKEACGSIALHLTKGVLLIIESTIHPGTTETIIKRLLEEGSKLKAGKDFYLAHCPERINPGDSAWRVDNIPRVVGGINEESVNRAAEFYKQLMPGTVIKKMKTLKEAEAVKMVENSFRDINIAFVNELSRVFSKSNIDLLNVLGGASTKPFAFMAHYPGCGVGGHCIPVDPYYLINYAKSNGCNLNLLKAARNVNNSMPGYIVRLAYKVCKELKYDNKQTPIGILGVSYKTDIDDCRESPALKIINIFKKNKTPTIVYDPYVSDLSTAASLDEVITSVRVLVIATDHTLFKSYLTADALQEVGVQAVVDGRNCLDGESIKKAGIRYVGVGRPLKK